jgi:hypothetical protein
VGLWFDRSFAEGYSTLTRMLALIFSNLSAKASTVFSLLQSSALTGHHGNLPVKPRGLRLNLLELGDAALAGVCEYIILWQAWRMRRTGLTHETKPYRAMPHPWPDQKGQITAA